MTNENMSLEDVLNDVMLEEPTPSYAALLRWTERYPQYQKDLADFFATWAVQAAQPQRVKVDEERLAAKGVEYGLEILRRQGRLIERESLSHLDQLVLRAVMALGGEDYAAPIYDKICQVEKTRVNMASMYAALDRLESKGLLSAWMSEPNEGGGQPKRYYRLLPAGLKALEEIAPNAERLAELLGDNSEGKQIGLAQNPKLRSQDT